jgi:hypothetical protein
LHCNASCFLTHTPLSKLSLISQPSFKFQTAQYCTRRGGLLPKSTELSVRTVFSET